MQCLPGGLDQAFQSDMGNAQTCDTTHPLRRACASLMIEQGWPVKRIQAVLGHSSVMTSMDVYGHLFTRAEDDVELFEKMEQNLMAA